MAEDYIGWFHIGETWNLFIGGNLEKVHVSFINVKGSGDSFIVDHFGIAGEKLRSLTLDADDLEPELKDREQCDRPLHI